MDNTFGRTRQCLVGLRRYHNNNKKKKNNNYEKKNPFNYLFLGRGP